MIFYEFSDGFVLPFALPFRTIIVGKKSTSKVTRIYSVTMGSHELASFEINGYLKQGEPKWANYVKGVIFQYLSDIPKDAAFDAVVWSNVP